MPNRPYNYLRKQPQDPANVTHDDMEEPVSADTERPPDTKRGLERRGDDPALRSDLHANHAGVAVENIPWLIVQRRDEPPGAKNYRDARSAAR